MNPERKPFARGFSVWVKRGGAKGVPGRSAPSGARDLRRTRGARTTRGWRKSIRDSAGPTLFRAAGGRFSGPKVRPAGSFFRNFFRPPEFFSPDSSFSQVLIFKLQINRRRVGASGRPGGGWVGPGLTKRFARAEAGRCVAPLTGTRLGPSGWRDKGARPALRRHPPSMRVSKGGWQGAPPSQRAAGCWGTSGGHFFGPEVARR